MPEIVKFLLVMVLSSFLDACWTFAITYTTRKKQVHAALWTGLGYAISAFSVIEYVSDKKMIGAVVIGAMFGCFFVVKYI